MADEPEIHNFDDKLILASWQHFFWICWLSPGDEQSAECVVSTHRRYIAERPLHSTVVLTHVTERATARPPNDATRDKLKEQIPIIRNTRAAVTVIEGRGFGAAIIRGLVSWFALFSKSTVPHEVHSTARDGLEFLLRHRDPKQARLGIDEVMRTYDRLLRG